MTTDNKEYVAALEDECARANALIGVLRLAAKGHVMAAPDYSLYRQYRKSREQRLGVLDTSENASSPMSLRSTNA